MPDFEHLHEMPTWRDSLIFAAMVAVVSIVIAGSAVAFIWEIVAWAI